MTISKEKIRFLFRSIQSFGWFIPISTLIISLGQRFLPQSFLQKLSKRNHRKIEEYLIQRLQLTIDSFSKQEHTMEYVPNAPIWYCWFQGESKMPSIPDLCLRSIKKHSNGHPIHLITLDNYQQYVQLPDYIISLLNEKKIKLAHFADILRVSLLYQYGGVWMDATIFLSDDIPEELFISPFYSIKIPEEGFYVSRCRWSVFFLAGWKNNPIYGNLLNLFYAYLKEDHLFVNYLMMDYFLDILYQVDSNVKDMIDNVPMNNPQTYVLKNVLCKEFNSERYSEITQNTSIFKLDWRMYTDEDLNNNQSNYYHYLKSMLS